MTPEQEATEARSIDAFIADVISECRPRGTNSAVTHVILFAAFAAANIASRDHSGAIQAYEARKILAEAINLLSGITSR